MGTRVDRARPTTAKGRNRTVSLVKVTSALPSNERTSCILIAASEKCPVPDTRWSVCGSTNLHHPQVIGRAGLAERNAGDNYDRVCRPGKCLSERCLSRTIDHLLVGVNILG
jgi:hypothetical protein